MGVLFNCISRLSDWATVATFSTQSVIEGYPFGNILSMSDGPIDKSSGTPYMYLTRLDFTALDLEVNMTGLVEMIIATFLLSAALVVLYVRI